MTTIGDISSASHLPILADDKPVVVRVKRKVFQSRLDAFWLEINERPLKRPLLDFESLSISESSEKGGLTTKKVFVKHVETLRSSEATVDIVRPFVDHNSSNTFQNKAKGEERRKSFKDIRKQDQLLVKARHEQEVLAKHARFEQIWRSRRGNDEANEHKLSEMCHFYDVIRVDGDERSNEVPQVENLSEEDQRILSSYLPLLQEVIPTAAAEIESDIQSCSSKAVCRSTEEYLYDYYMLTHDEEMMEGNVLYPYPLVKVDEEEFYDGPDDSKCDSDDSNGEDNPQNDYPDEIISEEEEEEEEEESESEGSDRETESEETESTSASSKLGNSEDDGIIDQLYDEDDFYDYDGGDADSFDYEACNDEDWRCSHE